MDEYSLPPYSQRFFIHRIVNITVYLEKVTAVSLCLCSVSQDDRFCDEDDLFSGEDEGFFTFSSSSPKILHLRQCLHCILMSEEPTLSMCGHTNEGIPSTEHVHMLHWACADIIMRGNPLTDMTDNTEDVNTNWQCLHTRIFVFPLSWLTSGCVWNVCILHIFSFYETIHSLHIIYKFGWQLGTETLNVCWCVRTIYLCCSVWTNENFTHCYRI